MNAKYVLAAGATVFFAAIVTALPARAAESAKAVEIWPKDSPELAGVKPEDIPKLQLYPGPQSNQKKPAVLITPGGGYKFYSNMAHYCQWLNGLGVAAYVVTYRLPGHGYKHPAPLHDAQRAMRIIRYNAEAWGLDPNRIGVLGNSSGGHLASTLETHFDRGDKDAKDPVERMSCRPDFAFLLSPVITMQGKYCHFYSRGRLLPPDPPKQLVGDLSNELQVTPDTPPTFLVAGGQDRLVPAENSLMFFEALRKNNVAFSELHFFSHGGHGYAVPTDAEWFAIAETWLKRLGIIGDLFKDPNVKKAMTDKGAWSYDPKTRPDLSATPAGRILGPTDGLR